MEFGERGLTKFRFILFSPAFSPSPDLLLVISFRGLLRDVRGGEAKIEVNGTTTVCFY